MAIADKYTAFAKALQDVQALDIGMWQRLDTDQRNWTGSYTASMKADVAELSRNGFPNQAKAIGDFWGDPGAWDYEKKLASGAANAVKRTLGGVSNAAAAVAQTGQNVAGAVGAGLVDTAGFLGALTNPHLWLRIGEAAMGILLLGIGVSIIAKSSSVGQSATKVAKTAAKVVK